MNAFRLVLTCSLALPGCAKSGEPAVPSGAAPSAATESPENPRDATLAVEVLYRERIALPPSAVVTAVLEDGAKMDVAAERVAQSTVAGDKGPPYNLALQYDPAKLNPKGRYGVRARIEDDGRLLFTSTTFAPAFGTEGRADETPNDPVRIVVRGVSRSADFGNHLSLTGTAWTLVALNGEPAGTGMRGKPATMTLQGAESRVSGFGGCNRFTGGYKLSDDGALTFPGGLAMTSMACPEGMDLERDLGQALGKAARFALEGQTLTLEDAEGVEIAKFTGKVEE